MQYRNASFAELKRFAKTPEEAEKLDKAFALAKEIFASDKETLQHQINTAFILAKLNLDIESITAALLHECIYVQSD